MIRWLKYGAVAVCATPQALVVVILMYALWGASAELYSAVIAGSHRGEFVAVMLSVFTVPFSCWLFANFLNLAHDLRELCVPKRRQRLAGALAFILALMWVIPCTLLALGHWAPRDLLLVAMEMPAGIAIVLLWRVGRRRTAGHAANLGRPRLALRIILGAPYAPLPWHRRLIQLLLVCAVLALPAVLVGFFGAALDRERFAALVHAAEMAGLLAAIGLCWLWPLSRAMALFQSTGGALSELALLPGMGEGRQQLLRLLRVIISVPAAGLVTLLSVTLGVAWFESLPAAIYWKAIMEFFLVLIITLPLVLGQMVRPRAAGAWQVTSSIAMQICVFSTCLWMVPWGVMPGLFMALRWLAWLLAAAVLICLAGLVAWTIHSVRELSRRPHPFVEISTERVQ